MDLELKKVEPKLVTLTAPRSSAAEQYRALRTNLEFLAVSGELRRIMVTSGTPGAGKSLTSANLAVVLAQAGKRVLLVDADLRRPFAHHLFGFPNLMGLSTAVTHPESWQTFVNQSPVPELVVMTSGPIPPNPAEILSSKVMMDLLEEMSRHFEMVIVDTPPVVSFTDAVALSQGVHGTLLVVRSGMTSRKVDLKGKERLEQVNARILGVVLNAMELPHDAYGYYYGYGEHQA